MTTPADPKPGASPVRPAVRPECVSDTRQGTGETGASPSPLPSGGTHRTSPPRDAPSQRVPNEGTHPSSWTPQHPSIKPAWDAVVANLQERQDRGLWSSRTIAATLAARAGALTYKRADDLIRSAIRHGYLEERPYPGNPTGHGATQTQIRLAARR